MENATYKPYANSPIQFFKLMTEEDGKNCNSKNLCYRLQRSIGKLRTVYFSEFERQKKKKTTNARFRLPIATLKINCSFPSS